MKTVSMKRRKTMKKNATQKTTMEKTHWPVHPLALLFSTKTPEERAELKKDMVDRANRGIEPLETPVLLWDGQILDGRHRDQIWMELAEEEAVNGFFKRTRPPTEEFKPGKDGTLAAWMRAKSRNLVVRQTNADQRAALFLKAVKQFPELKAVLDDIKEQNLQRKKAGRPLGAGDPRGNTNEQVAKMAQVGTTTVKQVKKLEKEAPDKFEEVAQGKTSAKKALKEVKEKKRTQPSKKGKTATETAPRKAPALNCAVELELVPVEGLTLDVVVDRLRVGKAEIRGLHVWQAGAKRVAPEPGAPLPKGCLATVTAIRAAKGFKLEEEA
jgi:hypothetical protein